MEHEYYYEEDIVRIIDTEDEMIYVFKFVGDRDSIYRMYDNKYNGEFCQEYEGYASSYDEISFRFTPYDDPVWPVTAEYET
jgi:hypothetical protein